MISAKKNKDVTTACIDIRKVFSSRKRTEIRTRIVDCSPNIKEDLSERQATMSHTQTFGECIEIFGDMYGLLYVLDVGKRESVGDLRAKFGRFVRRHRQPKLAKL